MAVLPFLEAARECVKKELAVISLHHNLGRVSKEKCFHVFVWACATCNVGLHLQIYFII